MRNLLQLVLAAVLLGGCAASTDVTKTGKGVYAATNANDLEILTVVPKDRQFVELATVSTSGWSTSETAKMHNALRAKSAPLGADAVVLHNSGIDVHGDLWTTGTAIRYTDHK